MNDASKCVGSHWTSWSTENYRYALAADFVRQLVKVMDSRGITQRMLAQKLGITDGRVSQIINDPGNLTLQSMIEYSRVIGLHVSIVAYDDGDSSNGPIDSQVFLTCWSQAGQPTDRFSLECTIPVKLRRVC